MLSSSTYSILGICDFGPLPKSNDTLRCLFHRGDDCFQRIDLVGEVSRDSLAEVLFMSRDDGHANSSFSGSIFFI